jgi:hypothetical protein
VDGEFRQLQGSLEQHYDGVAQVSLVKQRLAAPVTSGHRNRLERGASVRAEPIKKRWIWHAFLRRWTVAQVPVGSSAVTNAMRRRD